MIQFFKPGKPQGKARARTFYDKRTHSVRSITPPDTVKYEEGIKNCYLIACNDLKIESREAGKPFTTKLKWEEKEPLAVSITAQYVIPKSYSKKRKAWILNGQELPVKKPDADNILKVVCDALNGVAYHDDSQIVTMTIKKVYVENPKDEGLRIILKDIWE